MYKVRLACRDVAGYIGLLLCCLASAGATESALCTHGGRDSVAGSLGMLAASLDPEDRPKLVKPAADAVVLTLLVATACPESTEQVLRDDHAGSERLINEIRTSLHVVFTPAQGGLVAESLAGAIRCTPATPGLCSIQKELQGLLTTNGRRSARSQPCKVIGPTLVGGLTSDFNSLEGGSYVLGLTADLATVLGTCPSQFFAWMHRDPKFLNRWLVAVDAHLFWGEPGDKRKLEQYRREFIRLIEESLRDPSFTVEKKKILGQLRKTRVSTTD